MGPQQHPYVFYRSMQSDKDAVNSPSHEWSILCKLVENRSRGIHQNLSKEGVSLPLHQFRHGLDVIHGSRVEL